MERKRPAIIILVVLVVSVSVIAIYKFRTNETGIQGSIEVDGLNRTFMLYIPSSHDSNKQVPLLIALHGGGGSGLNMEKLTKYGFNKLAEEYDFLVVYPDGIQKHWNDGRGLEAYYTQRENIDDVKFISNLIDYIADNYNIDTKRVYVTGMSNGAFMSYRLACELTNKIAAIAPVDAPLTVNLSSSCNPSGPMPILYIQGTADPIVPWNGGLLKFNDQILGEVISVNETVEFWRTHNNCSVMYNKTVLPDKDPNDGTRVWTVQYMNPTTGVKVVFYGVLHGGHTWPNGYQYLPEDTIGKMTHDIDANTIIWNFLSQYSR